MFIYKSQDKDGREIFTGKQMHKSLTELRLQGIERKTSLTENSLPNRNSIQKQRHSRVSDIKKAKMPPPAAAPLRNAKGSPPGRKEKDARQEHQSDAGMKSLLNGDYMGKGPGVSSFKSLKDSRHGHVWLVAGHTAGAGLRTGPVVGGQLGLRAAGVGVSGPA